MKKRFETCVVTLTPLSPIHISVGNADYGWGAVWLRQSNKMVVLDSEKFTEKLIQSNLLDKYIEEVEKWTNLPDADKQKQSNPCYTFIQRNATLYEGMSLDDFVLSIKKEEYNVPPPTSFIRNGKGEAYIPGTTLKGAIRTAIIYAILQEHIRQTGNDYLNNTYLKKIFDSKPFVPNNSQKGADLRKGLDKELLEAVLEEFEISEKDETGQIVNLMQRPKPEHGPITNLMRAIIVSDSTPIPNVRNALVSEEIKIIMLESSDDKGNRYLNPQALPFAVGKNKRECYEPVNNASIQFELTIDREILQSFAPQTLTHKFPVVFKNLGDLQKIINDFYSNVWRFEQDFFLKKIHVDKRTEGLIEGSLNFFDDSMNKLKPNFNIGLGSGMICKTLFVMMNEEYRIKIRNLQMTGRQIRNHNNGMNGAGKQVDWKNKIAPNSRHLIFRNNKSYRPLGWANLSFGETFYKCI